MVGVDFCRPSDLEFFYLPENLLMSGKCAALAAVVVDKLPIDSNSEYAAAPSLELRLYAEPFPDCGRKTFGLREVVSLNAVGDLDCYIAHNEPP